MVKFVQIRPNIYLMLRTAYNISIYIYNKLGSKFQWPYIYNISITYLMTFHLRVSRRRAERWAPAGRLGPRACYLDKYVTYVRRLNSEKSPKSMVWSSGLLWSMRTATDCGWTAISREMAKEILRSLSLLGLEYWEIVGQSAALVHCEKIWLLVRCLVFIPVL